MWSKAFGWTQLYCFPLARFHSDYFLLQNLENLVPTLDKLTDFFILDPRQTGNTDHILEGDFRAVYDRRTLGLGRTRGTCLERFTSNTDYPKECHASHTDHQTRSCKVVSSHPDLRLEFVELVERHKHPLGSLPFWSRLII